MMTNRLSELLDEREWLLLDGATGTNLFAMGLQSGDSPELWNIDEPDRVRALHDGFIAAGSDVILTNSFGGTRYRLALHGAHDRVAELNAAAARLARERADAAGRPVAVAGSVGPTGELLEPVGTLPLADAVDAFREQIRGLLDGGVDVIWAETMSSAEEYRAVATAAAAESAPFVGTLSFDTAGRTMMGLTSTAVAGLAGGLPTAPLAFGANCGTGASDLIRTVVGLRLASPDAIIVAKANAGIPKWIDGAVVYDGTPELMATYATMAFDAGARLIGGCCGTTAQHLVAMRAALESHHRGAPPSSEQIVAHLGEFSSPDDGTGPEQVGARSPRRSRRRSATP